MRTAAAHFILPSMFSDVLLPVFSLVAVGWGLGRALQLDPAAVGKLVFWCLSPALIFDALRTAELPVASLGLVAAFVAAHYLAMFLISLPLRRWLFPQDTDAQVATSLVLTFGNCGNLGLPILLFAFGRTGYHVGAAFLATNTALMATLGVAIATWQGQRSLRRPLAALFKVPWGYAVLAAGLARWAGPLPTWLARATGLLADGAIPLLLLLLGLQLARVRPRQVARAATILAVARLGLGGLLAWGLGWAFGVGGVLRGSLVVEGSVPTAVNSFLLAMQYGRRPDLAASALLLSTLLSAGTLTLTLFLLQG
ncbi:MAG: AEC family transporter [Candidatus Bipolaricaulaceae bacterium]